MNPLTAEFIRTHAADDLDRLLLNASKFEGVDVPWAVAQIEARRRLAEKVPSWCANRAVQFPVRVSQEQCSSEFAARYKAGLCAGATMADLTGGFGVDCYFLGQGFDKVFYVEHNADLCALARHNFSALNFVQATVCELEAADFLQNTERLDLVYIDPARRNAAGQRVVLLSDCAPDVVALRDVLQQRATKVLLKLSPMLDIASVLRAFPETCAVYVVAVDGECKELLFLIDWKATEKVRFHAVNLQKSGQQMFDFSPEEEHAAACIFAEKIETYLYEPNAAVLKSGAFRLVAERFGLKKLHPNTHLYTADMACADFPGRVFEVVAQSGFGKRDVSALLQSVTKANLATRNFPESVETLRRRLKIKEGGDDYLFACTAFGNEKLLLRCKKCFALG